MINTPHAYAFRLECCDHRLNPHPFSDLRAYCRNRPKADTAIQKSQTLSQKLDKALRFCR
jgi:hypothetical protein